MLDRLPPAWGVGVYRVLECVFVVFIAFLDFIPRPPLPPRLSWNSWKIGPTPGLPPKIFPCDALPLHNIDHVKLFDCDIIAINMPCYASCVYPPIALDLPCHASHSISPVACDKMNACYFTCFACNNIDHMRYNEIAPIAFSILDIWMIAMISMFPTCILTMHLFHTWLTLMVMCTRRDTSWWMMCISAMHTHSSFCVWCV